MIFFIPALRRASRIAALLLACATASAFAATKVGLAFDVSGDGFFLNPVVTQVKVSEVSKDSLAERAGIVTGDEILQVDGTAIVGKRASEVSSLARFNPGETRTLRLKRASGEEYEARITKPVD